MYMNKEKGVDIEPVYAICLYNIHNIYINLLILITDQLLLGKKEGRDH